MKLSRFQFHGARDFRGDFFSILSLREICSCNKQQYVKIIIYKIFRKALVDARALVHACHDEFLISALSKQPFSSIAVSVDALLIKFHPRVSLDVRIN